MSNYSCSVCGVSSKTKGTIQTHINSEKCKGAQLIVDLILIKCEVCGKECETEKLMASHKNNCVKKRVQVINNDANGELKKQNEEILKIILLMKNQLTKSESANEELRREVDTLTRRVEKLEFVKPKYEPLTQEELDAGDSCNYCEKIQFKPTSRKHFEDMHRMNEIKVDNGDSVEVVLNGETIETTGYLYEDHILLDSGPAYYFDKAEVTRSDLKHISKLKVMMRKICKNNSTCKREGIFYCEEHAI